MTTFIQEQKNKAFENLEKTIEGSRLETRSLWGKLLTTTLAILGFSFTLFSTDFLSSQIMCSAFAKYLFFFSWFSYFCTLVAGFYLLREETGLEREKALIKSFYADDIALIMSNIEYTQDKKNNMLLTLSFLHQKRLKEDSLNIYTKEVLDIFEANKKDLLSYRYVKNPDDFYTNKKEKNIDCLEKIFYSLIFIGTIFSVSGILNILIFIK